MKICLYSSVFFPSIGGLEQVSYTLASYWVTQGHQVNVVTDTPATDGQDSTYIFPVIRCPNFECWKSLLNKSDCIISNGYSLRHLAVWLLSRKPIIWIHPNYIPKLILPNQNSLKSLIRSLLARVMLPLAAGHIYVSHAIQRQVGAHKGIVIYNPIEDRFRPLPNVKIDNDFAFFGRIIPDKGVDTLLEALAICKSKSRIYRLDLYGEGYYVEELHKLALTLGVDSQLRWYPFLRNEELVQAMNAAGAVVVPSRWAEPMGIVAVEAMACGKVVIGSRYGGLGEVLEGYGMTFENGNAEQLAECMIQLKEDPDLQQNLEKKAYKRSRHFAIAEVGSKYIQMLELIVKN